MTPETPKKIRPNGQVRHELKYIVPASVAPEIRMFAEPFCVPDPEATGSPPQYRVTTLQLDTLGKALHLAKEREQLNRFKLRVRTYGNPGEHVEFLEIKRKLEAMVKKTRCMLQPGTFGPDLLTTLTPPPGLRSRDVTTFWDFLRLKDQLDARPMIIIRYLRESWIGRNNPQQRITFDRELEYALCNRWSFQPEGCWRRMDTATAFGLPFAPLILEMKSSASVPIWMLELIRFFSLQRVGFCKYSTAMRLESIFEGNTYSQASENTSYW